MKILLDENIDPRLKAKINSNNFPVETFSTKDKGWLGVKNGDLLLNAVNENFDVFVSADQQLKISAKSFKHRINIIIFKLVKNNYGNQLLKLPELNQVIENIYSDKTKLKYYEI